MKLRRTWRGMSGEEAGTCDNVEAEHIFSMYCMYVSVLNYIWLIKNVFRKKVLLSNIYEPDYKHSLRKHQHVCFVSDPKAGPSSANQWWCMNTRIDSWLDPPWHHVPHETLDYLLKAVEHKTQQSNDPISISLQCSILGLFVLTYSIQHSFVSLGRETDFDWLP